MKKILILVATMLTVACADTGKTPQAPKPTEKKTAFTYSASISTEPAEVKPGEVVKLNFSIQDSTGKILTVNNLEVVHEKLIHLLVISDDLSYFDHIHPEQSPSGDFTVETKFPTPGKYRLYMDYTPAGAGHQLGRMEVNVEGTPAEPAKLIADKELVKVVDGIRFEMKSDKPFTTNQPIQLSFVLSDEKTGKPITDLEPYLGAFAHFVLVNEGHSEYLHAHPLLDAPSPDARGGPEVGTQTLFPKPGLYKVWGQFQRSGKIYTVPMVINVAESGNQPAAVAQMKGNEQEIEVRVSKDGYTPSTIRLKKGIHTHITFLRVDEKNCAGELVFPDLGIKKDLPLGKPVTVELMPDKDGEIRFTCGMEMYRGKLLVASN